MKTYKVKRDFVSPVYGNKKVGDALTIPANLGEHFILIGLVEEPAPEEPVKAKPKPARKPRKKTE